MTRPLVSIRHSFEPLAVWPNHRELRALQARSPGYNPILTNLWGCLTAAHIECRLQGPPDSIAGISALDTRTTNRDRIYHNAVSGNASNGVVPGIIRPATPEVVAGPGI